MIERTQASPTPSSSIRPAEAAARAVAQCLRNAGHEALFAGGFVRDRLLGIESGGDVDVATSARPEEVEALFPRTVAVGKQFGVILVLEGSLEVEVATFRADGAYVDGRHPTEVRFTSREEDAERRDFTINGMFFDPASNEVEDFVGGQRDLEARVIRAIGDPSARFREDRLRLLRAVRFAARLGFEIEEQTAAAIREMAPAIQEVSGERIGEELVKILTEGSSARGFLMLDDLGLLEALLPEMTAMHGVGQGKEHHPEGDVFEHTVEALRGVDRLPPAERSEAIALGVLLHDVAKPLCRGEKDGRITFYGHCEQGADMAAGIVRRLRRSGATAKHVSWLVKSHLRHLDAKRMRPSTLKRFLRQDGIEELLRLCRIDAMASSGWVEELEFCSEALERLTDDELRPKPFVRGGDLIALGHRPGPAFHQILEAVEQAQLDGDLADRDAAMAFVRTRYPVEPT